MSVSLPSSLGIGEEDGMLQLCATISAIGITERDFDVILSANDNTGITTSLMRVPFPLLK